MSSKIPKRSEFGLFQREMFSKLSKDSPKDTEEITLDKHNSLVCGDWHQITNPFDEVCKIIEINMERNHRRHRRFVKNNN